MTAWSMIWPYTYEGIFSQDSIAQAVANAREALEPTATIKDFLPILVSRFAREQLTAAAQTDGRLIKPVPELLFACVQNAGRSQMAAALAQHLSAGKVHVRSAGSRPRREDQSAGCAGSRRARHNTDLCREKSDKLNI